MEKQIIKTIKATKETELITVKQFIKENKKRFNSHELVLITNALINGQKITLQLATYKIIK